MFVVTDEGVLVADGQGSPDETRLLVETIAGITSQPITHVVVCSDHGDHTAGNAEFPDGALFHAHPTSRAILQAAADNPDRPDTAPPIVVPTEVGRGKRGPHARWHARSTCSFWDAPTRGAIWSFTSPRRRSSS